MMKSRDASANFPAAAKLVSLFAYPFIWGIYLYRLLLSPFFANSCRFTPSCSHYSEGAYRKYGAIRGSMLTIKRICRCHPWNPGGFDPVP